MFNLSFITCIFPLVHKAAKIVSVFKKDLKQDYINYLLIPLLSNIEKILKNLCIKYCIPFSTTILSITYNLVSDSIILHHTPLISITENIRKALGKGNIGCVGFVNLQKAFDTVDHQILLAKLDHYGILGVSSDWIKSYLSNLNQFISINRYDTGLAAIKCDIPQGSVIGPLLFLLHINDLNQAIKFPKVHLIADNTNLLCQSNFSKKVNKLVHADLKHLVNWLSANKILLNVKN